jgi:predicted RNA-binding Zn-ribbon protein involved in translation (DUF1610 family)
MFEYETKEQVDIRASGTICPVPNCGALVVAYRAARKTRRASVNWDFVCPSCGFEFTAFENDLVFQSVPRDWLLSEVCHA